MTQSTLEQRRIDRTDVARGARNDWPWYAYKHAGNNQTVVGYVVDIYDLDVGHESRATGSDDVEKIGDIRRMPGGFVHQLCEVNCVNISMTLSKPSDPTANVTSYKPFQVSRFLFSVVNFRVKPRRQFNHLFPHRTHWAVSINQIR